MTSITIRNVSSESIARLRRRAEVRGCSLEALARSILDEAAEGRQRQPGSRTTALVEPGEDIEPFIREHRSLASEPFSLEEARRMRGSGWDGDLDETRGRGPAGLARAFEE